MPSPEVPAPHSVVVLPRSIEFAATHGESIMAAALRSGFTWPTTCNGGGTCSVCFVLVDAGAENLTRAVDAEQSTLSTVYPRYPARPAGEVRLACQAKVLGPVTVRKAGVRAQTPPAAGSTPAKPAA